MADKSDITGLLSAAKRGESEAEAKLFALLYPDLRQIAHARLRQSKPYTLLDTTALVHEAYLRLHRAGYVQVADRSHFLAYAARTMRSIVVDLVRKRGMARQEIRDANDLPDRGALPEGEKEILRVDHALQELALVSERLVKVVEMRYFAGMNEAEIAEALSLTERTVRRDWQKARILLAAALK
ncbi:MAG TPA: ECF-type sigma factor [Bryobacteraceae bacterium]|nr:ECF-type sigma factor [Bryobacteraceae bacterium]